jgi:hypothetical protein
LVRIRDEAALWNMAGASIPFDPGWVCRCIFRFERLSLAEFFRPCFLVTNFLSNQWI